MKIVLEDKFALVTEHWSPKLIAQVNDTHVRIAKLLGEFDWHHHEDEDELFWVLRGRLLIQFRDGEVWLGRGGGAGPAPGVTRYFDERQGASF